jgi:hypothetical protein
MRIVPKIATLSWLVVWPYNMRKLGRKEMKTLIAIFILLASTGYAFAPSVQQKTHMQTIESTVWCVLQNKTMVDAYMAILFHESRYDNGARGYNVDGSYDFGVAQLNSRYWNPAQKYYGEDITTVRGNVYAGAKFFASLVNYFRGDVGSAIMAYNCGAGAVSRGFIPDSTRKYAARIMMTMAYRRV